ncbi:MAG: response regulator transcription factor [Bacteroidota bacterium]|nr:response regulator transcription factor [Bacteroidota bacterium]
MKTRILIYEDNNDFREALVQLINTSENFECAGDYRNCNDILKHITDSRPAVVLMDIDMPDMNGIEGVRQVRGVDRDIKIIMLTVFDDNKNVINAICAGASGYLLKKNCLNKLFDAIREVLEGGAPMSATIARMVLEFVAAGSPVATEQYNLTAREKTVLAYLVKGYSYKMIASPMDISIETVKTHIRNIYEKLQVHNQSEAVAKALKNRIIK